MASKVDRVVLVKVVGNAPVLGLPTLAEEYQAVQAVELLSTGDGAVKTAEHLGVLGQISLSDGAGLL
jgi:hypothetical protein